MNAAKTMFLTIALLPGILPIALLPVIDAYFGRIFQEIEVTDNDPTYIQTSSLPEFFYQIIAQFRLYHFYFFELYTLAEFPFQYKVGVEKNRDK